MNSVENVENFSSFMAGVFLTRREISCSELSYLMNDYSIKMNSCIVEDDDEFYMFNNFIHFDNKKIFVKEAYDDYVKIHTKDGMNLKKKTMSHFESVLDPAQFVRVHRSYIVNLQELTRIEPLEKDSHIALLKSGVQIPLSQSGYTKLKTILGI